MVSNEHTESGDLSRTRRVVSAIEKGQVAKDLAGDRVSDRLADWGVVVPILMGLPVSAPPLVDWGRRLEVPGLVMGGRDTGVVVSDLSAVL